MNIVILGLSITSSWGNGHATTYRSLVRGLKDRGHRILFLERDVEWYAGNRDEPNPPGARTVLYQNPGELFREHEAAVVNADLVIVGSFVPDGIEIGNWVTSIAKGVTAFYDIDTPVTLEALQRDTSEYVNRDLVRRYHLYLSFTGGPTLHKIQSEYRSPMARPLYCSVDPARYAPVNSRPELDLGYLGTYSDDRQPGLDALLLEPARRWPQGRFMVAGPMYPDSVKWPSNVKYTIHLSPREHPAFYGSQRFTLNITREAMKRAGYSPSVRLFEAAACAVPVISDWWPGLDSIFEVSRQILIAEGPEDTLRLLRNVSDRERLSIAHSARDRILAEHTPAVRSAQLERYVNEIRATVREHRVVHA